MSNIIFSNDVLNLLYFTNFDKLSKSFVVLRLRMNIWIIPETNHFIIFFQIHNWHASIRSAANMK